MIKRVYPWAVSVKKILVVVVLYLFIVSSGYNHPFESSSCYQLCFTPQHNCTAKIIRSIDQAASSIYVQAYSFTSKPILYALLTAKQRGITVKVILDKSHLARRGFANQLLHAGIPVWIDSPAGIAHNKVMIIDKSVVITGSFNFSYSAQYRNRENVLWLTDKTIARRYLENWKACQIQSLQLTARRKAPRVTTTTSTGFLCKGVGILGCLTILWMILGSL